MMPEVRIGCSGFLYSHWRENFYPRGVPQRKWLEYYAERFSTVELNVTFYRLPDKAAFRKWRGETPEGFSFSLKGSRFITHIKRLKSPAEPVKLFMERAAVLKDKLAVILWQFPANFKKDAQRLEEFLEALRPYGMRNTFEFRNETWMDKEITSLLKREGQGLCMADWPPFVNDLPVTAGFVYMRRHGHGGSYDTCYSTKELKGNALRIKKYLMRRKDVFVYFNNDAFGYAPRNALELKEMLG
jgi:uncharacterized protein YecE (DUF72 family)